MARTPEPQRTYQRQNLNVQEAEWRTGRPHRVGVHRLRGLHRLAGNLLLKTQKQVTTRLIRGQRLHRPVRKHVLQHHAEPELIGIEGIACRMPAGRQLKTVGDRNGIRWQCNAARRRQPLRRLLGRRNGEEDYAVTPFAASLAEMVP